MVLEQPDKDNDPLLGLSAQEIDKVVESRAWTAFVTIVDRHIRHRTLAILQAPDEDFIRREAHDWFARGEVAGLEMLKLMPQLLIEELKHREKGNGEESDTDES